MKQVVYYKDERGKCPYLEWYNSLNQEQVEVSEKWVEKLFVKE